LVPLQPFPCGFVFVRVPVVGAIEQPNVYAVGDAARLVAQRLHALHPPPLPDAAKPGTPKAYSA
jgi:hypothetical protein